MFNLYQYGTYAEQFETAHRMTCPTVNMSTKKFYLEGNGMEPRLFY
jgi:hypothetical protein